MCLRQLALDAPPGVFYEIGAGSSLGICKKNPTSFTVRVPVIFKGTFMLRVCLRVHCGNGLPAVARARLLYLTNKVLGVVHCGMGITLPAVANYMPLTRNILASSTSTIHPPPPLLAYYFRFPLSANILLDNNCSNH